MVYATPASPDNEAIRELRDEVKKLNQSIEKFNTEASNQTAKMISLTKFIVVLTTVLVVGLMVQIWLARIQTTPVLLEQERSERRAYEICKNNPTGEYNSVSGVIIQCEDAVDVLRKKFDEN